MRTLEIIVIPFLIGAVVHFAPIWLSIPAALVLGMVWVGACILVAQEEKQ